MSDTSGQYMEIFDRLPISGLLVNISGRPNFVANKKFLSMIAYEENEFYSVMSTDYTLIFDTMDILSLREDLREAAGKQVTVSRELKITDHNEKRIYTVIEAEATERNDGEYYMCSLVDITQLKMVQLELQNEKRRLSTIINSTNDIIYEYDFTKDQMSFFDDSYCLHEKGTACEIEDFFKTISDNNMIHPEDVGKLMPLCMGREVGRIEIRMHRASDKSQYYWYEMLGTMLFNENRQPYLSVGVLRDIDETKKKTLGFKQMAERDSLTRLFNHDSVKAQVEAYFLEGGKDKNNALILIDLDDFKSVNDTYGHRFGDTVIKETADMLLKVFGANDIVGRIGGDEYLVFCKDMLEMTAIQEKLERLFETFSSHPIGDKEQFIVRASVGIAVSSGDSSTYKRLFDKADRSMYKVKRSGKNTYDFVG